MPLQVNSVKFTGNNNKDNDHIRATEIGVGTGATVGTVKYGVNAFKRFKLTGKIEDVAQLSGKTTDAIKQAANIGAQTKSLYGKALSNAKAYKEAIIKWGKSLKVAKWMKPIFESKAFAKFSGVLGGVTAGFVFISGIGEMSNTFSSLTNN